MVSCANYKVAERFAFVTLATTSNRYTTVYNSPFGSKRYLCRYYKKYYVLSIVNTHRKVIVYRDECLYVNPDLVDRVSPKVSL